MPADMFHSWHAMEHQQQCGLCLSGSDAGGWVVKKLYLNKMLLEIARTNS